MSNFGKFLLNTILGLDLSKEEEGLLPNLQTEADTLRQERDLDPSQHEGFLIVQDSAGGFSPSEEIQKFLETKNLKLFYLSDFEAYMGDKKSTDPDKIRSLVAKIGNKTTVLATSSVFYSSSETPEKLFSDLKKQYPSLICCIRSTSNGKAEAGEHPVDWQISKGYKDLDLLFVLKEVFEE